MGVPPKVVKLPIAKPYALQKCQLPAPKYQALAY